VAADPPIRLGVVGLGLIAQSVHLPSLAQLRDRFEVRHVCDASRRLAESIADELPGQVQVATDWRDLCRDESLDAVLLLTPGAHAEIALAALRAGKHVFAEKPLCVTQAEATELASAAATAGRILQVGYMKMYDPAIRRAREELGRLGRVRVVRVTVLHPSDEGQFEHVRVRRFDDADPGVIAAAAAYDAGRVVEALGPAPAALAGLYNDVLLGSVIHELSLLRALGLGLPAMFDHADMRPLSIEQPAAEPPCLLAVGNLGGGAQLQLSWNWVPDYPDYTEEVAVFGTAGRLRLLMPGPYSPGQAGRLRVQRADGSERREADYTWGHITGFARELAAFAGSVTTGTAPLADAAGAREDTRCLQALTGAIASRAGVSLGGEAAAS
jgi:predicted dehydrogenase